MPNTVTSIDPRRERRRRFWNGFFEQVVRLAGISSVVLLLAIFAMLAVNAARTFGGGVEMAPLTPRELAELSPEAVAELLSRPTDPPHLFGDFLFGTLWTPQSVEEPRYGVLSLVVSTLLTTFGAIVLSAPVGLAVAAWLAYVAKGWLRETIKFGVELIAAIPSVVVGFLGIQLVGPVVGEVFGRPGGLTALNGSILLAIMALPTIVSISEDAFTAVPRSLIQGSLALGADGWQTLMRVSAPAARSGLVAAVMLGTGRAIGETMTVLMATGNVAAMPHSLLDPVRTMTATIAIELGEVARGTTHYFALFTVGLLLFLITLAVNLAADFIQRRQERLYS
jgi:phosphate transport system permease protein